MKKLFFVTTIILMIALSGCMEAEKDRIERIEAIDNARKMRFMFEKRIIIYNDWSGRELARFEGYCHLDLNLFNYVIWCKKEGVEKKMFIGGRADLGHVIEYLY